MENKWIELLESGIEMSEIDTQVFFDAQEIVSCTDANEKAKQKQKLIEFCKYLVKDKASGASDEEFKGYCGLVDRVVDALIAFRNISTPILELVGAELGSIVWSLVQMGTKRGVGLTAALIKVGVDYALQEYSEEEQDKAKADLLIAIIEKDDPQDLSLYKTIMDYYDAKTSKIDSLVKHRFVPYVEKCLNNDEELAKILLLRNCMGAEFVDMSSEDNDEIRFVMVCERIMFLYEREKNYAKEKDFLQKVMDTFKDKSDLVYYIIMCDLGRMIYVTSNGAEEATAMKYFQESAAHGISAAEDAIKIINNSKEYQNKYSKHIKMRNIFAIATAVIDVASIICFCVTTPIVGTILLLAVAGILASISLIFGVRAGEVKAKAENDKPKVNRQLGIRNIVSDLVGIPYYPLVIVGGVLVPLIVSSIMGFFLSSKY